MPQTIRDLTVETRAIASLTPYQNNARTHSAQQIQQIADSIKAFGWTNPILIDEAGKIIAGHGRLEAAKLLGLDHVPVLPLAGMNDIQKRAYIIADNKLAENAGWDNDILRVELVELVDFGFDLDVIGFETPVFVIILCADVPASDPVVPALVPGPAITRPGDLWHLGDHRLYCGDALKPESYTALLEGAVASAMFTDPPYNVPINGHVSGLGKIKHTEFVMASGEMSDAEFLAFLKTFCVQAQAALKPAAIAYICMDWRHIADLVQAGQTNLGELINLCVWNKMTGGMGSLYRSQHELVGIFRTAGTSLMNNVQLGKFGRNRTNVWDYKGVQARRDELKLHPTVKPIAMIADAIKDVTKRGELILDPFAGSGSTILAAEQCGRKAVCLELDPKYVDVTIRRFQNETGKSATHAVWGQTFDEIEAEQEEEANV